MPKDDQSLALASFIDREEGAVFLQFSSVVTGDGQKLMSAGEQWSASTGISPIYGRFSPWLTSVEWIVEPAIFSTCATSVAPEKIICAPSFNTLPTVDAAQCHTHKYENEDVARGEKTLMAEPQYVVDCRNLSATDLRRKYKAEANSHRNMLQRAPTRGNTVHPKFQRFRGFLMHVGPVPCRGASLDRTNNDDLEYAPGKVRWADKRTQNSNKGDNLLFQSSRTNKSYTVSHLARLQKISPSTVRKRLHRGWTDDEIIDGKRRGASGRLALQPQSLVRHHCRIRSQPADHEKTGREIVWEGRARYAEWHREHEGEEYCLADPETINEVAAEVGVRFSREVYQRKFAKWWAEWKPHLRKNRLPLWAQGWIAEIEENSSELANRMAQLRDHL